MKIVKTNRSVIVWNVFFFCMIDSIFMRGKGGEKQQDGVRERERVG
jgi:hypothetical protein